MSFFARIMCVVFIWGIFASPSIAGIQQLGPKNIVSAGDVAEAVRNSPLNPSLKQYADDIGKLAMFESSGNTGVFNGDCCTGILQMNTTNLEDQGYTRESYANASLQEQVNAWAKLTNNAANAAPVKKLMGMSEFDGQKVDGAMVLACIQLGPGNCGTMISGGTCNSWHDGMPYKRATGTTICKMADKIRGGASSAPNNGNLNETTQPIKESGGKFADMILEKAKDCWVCTAVVKAGEMTVQIIPVTVKNITTPILPLAAIIFALVTAIQIGRVFIWPGLLRWSDIFWTFCRFVAVYALISSAAFVSDFVLGYGLYPAVQMGSEIGEMGADQVHKAYGQSANGNDSDCVYEKPKGVPQEALKSIESMGKIACRMHNAAYGPVVAAALLIKADTGQTTFASIFSGLFLVVVGFVMAVASLFALAAFGVSVIEALLKITIVFSLSPIILFFWIWNRTRYLAANAFNLVMFAFFLLAISGFLASISTFVMTQMISAGMQQSMAGATELQAVFTWVNSKMATVNMSELVLFASFCIAGAMMSANLLRSGSDIAASLTGAAVGQITRNVVSSLRNTTMMVATPVIATGMATVYAGMRAGGGALNLVKGLSSGGGAGRIK